MKIITKMHGIACKKCQNKVVLNVLCAIMHILDELTQK